MAAATSKPIVWVGASLDDLRGFPTDARNDTGYQLEKIQHGMEPSDWKPMTSVGRGVREIRIRTAREHRVFYIATFEEAVYVLHAFEKKSQKTLRADIELARRRYRLVLETRRPSPPPSKKNRHE